MCNSPECQSEPNALEILKARNQAALVRAQDSLERAKSKEKAALAAFNRASGPFAAISAISKRAASAEVRLVMARTAVKRATERLAKAKARAAVPEARIYWCVRCQARVVICRLCDRGQDRCTECQNSLRIDNHRKSQKKYQDNKLARLRKPENKPDLDKYRKHRAHLRTEQTARDRAKKSVTDRGSSKVTEGASKRRPAKRVAQVTRNLAPSDDGSFQCSVCGRPVDGLMRTDFIHRGGERINLRKPAAT